MAEKKTSNENHHEKWVPFSTGALGQPHKEEYDLISWQPALIPEGKRLRLDVIGINKLLRTTHIGFPIEIQSMSKAKEDESEASFVSNGVDSAVLLATKKSKKHKNFGEFFLDKKDNKGYARIDFNGISEHVASELPQGRNDAKYSTNYGRLIDTAIKHQLGQATVANFYSQYPNQEIEGGDIDRTLWGLIVASPALLFAFIELFNLNPMNSLNDLVLAIGSLEVAWLGKGIFDLTKTDAYGEYLRDKLLHGSLEDKLKEMYPHKFMSYLAVPYVANKLWYKEIVKGND